MITAARSKGGVWVVLAVLPSVLSETKPLDVLETSQYEKFSEMCARLPFPSEFSVSETNLWVLGSLCQRRPAISFTSEMVLDQSTCHSRPAGWRRYHLQNSPYGAGLPEGVVQHKNLPASFEAFCGPLKMRGSDYEEVKSKAEHHEEFMQALKAVLERPIKSNAM